MMIGRIEDLDFSEEKFYEESLLQDALVFRLTQAVEAAIDVGTHLVSALEIARTETARDVFEELAKNKILSKDTAEAMGKAVGFRNLAVHEYDEESFDIREVYRDYKNDIVDLRRFITEVMEYLLSQ